MDTNDPKLPKVLGSTALSQPSLPSMPSLPQMSFTSGGFGGPGKSQMGINWGAALAAKYNNAAEQTASDRLKAEAAWANAATARGLLQPQIDQMTASTALTQAETAEYPEDRRVARDYTSAMTDASRGAERRLSMLAGPEFAALQMGMMDRSLVPDIMRAWNTSITGQEAETSPEDRLRSLVRSNLGPRIR